MKIPCWGTRIRAAFVLESVVKAYGLKMHYFLHGVWDMATEPAKLAPPGWIEEDRSAGLALICLFQEALDRWQDEELGERATMRHKENFMGKEIFKDLNECLMKKIEEFILSEVNAKAAYSREIAFRKQFHPWMGMANEANLGMGGEVSVREEKLKPNKTSIMDLIS